MAKVYTSEIYVPAPTRANSVWGLAAFLIIGLMAFVAIHLQSPPEAVDESAPLSEFSSARALHHIQAFAQEPHPIGSPEHAKVRRYILDELTALGLTPEVQEASVVSGRTPGPIVAGTVRNVLARIKGTEHSNAVMLTAHYDSVPNGPGASDDGSGVAAMLETARALKSNPSLKNDVVLLFTDGEEAGLLGASAFVQQHPWIKDIKLVLNFDARGTGGPSLMFETSPDNGWLVREFASAAPYPQANSLASDIYRLLPNDTDMSVFKEAGLPGLNFAFLEGVAYYHSKIDDLRRIDERSLQHQGAYMLNLTRHFGNLDLAVPREPDAVYFNLPGDLFLYYSSGWAATLSALVGIGFVAVIITGLRRRQLSYSGIARGALASFLSMTLAPVVVTILWWIISYIHIGYSQMRQGDTYNSQFYMLGFSLLTVAISWIIYNLFREKVSFYNLAAGALFWWLILLIASALFLPGASYIFTWPLLSALIGLGFTFTWKDLHRPTAKKLLVVSLCVMPAVVLFAPLIEQVYAGLTLRLSGPVMIIVALLAGLLIPAIEFISTRSRWAPPIVVILASVVCLIAGSLTSGFDAAHPRPDNLFYILDPDRDKALWASADNGPDQWTSQFFGPGTERGTLFDYFPLNPSPVPFLKCQAPKAALAAPEVSLLSETTSDGVRTVQLRIVSPRQAPVISIYVESNGQPIEAAINGKSAEEGRRVAQRRGGLGATYYGLPREGIELSLKSGGTEPIKIRLIDRSYGLPVLDEVSFQPRPDHLIPAPISNSDSTYVSKTFTF